MTQHSNDQAPHSPTPNSSDAYLIPAETAARRNREGNDDNHGPNPANGADSGAMLSSYTVDTEGLVNNYAIEPEMYVATPGDRHWQNDGIEMADMCTIIDTFSSSAAAEQVVIAMQNAGLAAHQISIFGKGYDDSARGDDHGALTWEDITELGGLTTVLVEMGISMDETLRYEADIEAGKFIVFVIGSEEDIDQTYEILHDIGHKLG